jgi:pyruvate kinase
MLTGREAGMRRVKIVATVGPASRALPTLAALIEAGVDVVRVNMSHGTPEEHAEVIARVRELSEDRRKAVAVLMDLAGPKLRIGDVREGRPIELRTGARVRIVAEEIVGDETRLSTNYPPLIEEASVGDRLLIADGALEMVVEEKETGALVCRVVHGGWVGPHAGMNVPGVPLSLSALTEKDRRDLRFGIEQEVDYIGLSFVRSAADCQLARRLIEEAGARIPLIAKIEKAEAVHRLDEILKAADGLMVARGDLGVETSVESVPLLQKEIIAKANRAGKIVITATQMLQSMIENPRPTRAEASDVANAVLDGTDAVMLSGETAIGQFPVEAVRVMDRIVRAAEASPLSRSRLREAASSRPSGSLGRALAEAAAFAAEEVKARLIVVFTESGNMPRQVAALRPPQRLIALTPSRATSRQLAAVWGVEPYLFPFPARSDDLLSQCDRLLLCEGLARPGEVIVLMAGTLRGLGFSDMMKLHRVGEPLS